MLQQQLIKAERERILQGIQTGKLPADTALPVIRALEEEDDEDEHRPLKKLKMAKAEKTSSNGGRI